MRILIGNQQSLIQVTGENEAAVENVLMEAARQFELPDNTEVSITFIDDSGIRELNKRYRGIDQATDVLSFAFDEENGQVDGAGFVSGADVHVLGDIIISLERAKLQAGEYGHSFERELGFLALHGALHLLGFDHSTEEETAKMRELEKKILRAVQLFRE